VDIVIGNYDQAWNTTDGAAGVFGPLRRVGP
jgi:hypothetical protein